MFVLISRCKRCRPLSQELELRGGEFDETRRRRRRVFSSCKTVEVEVFDVIVGSLHGFENVRVKGIDVKIELE